MYALICGSLVTVIFVIGLLVRTRGRVLGMGYDSLAVILIYIFSLFILIWNK